MAGNVNDADAKGRQGASDARGKQRLAELIGDCREYADWAADQNVYPAAARIRKLCDALEACEASCVEWKQHANANYVMWLEACEARRLPSDEEIEMQAQEAVFAYHRPEDSWVGKSAMVVFRDAYSIGYKAALAAAGKPEP